MSRRTCARGLLWPQLLCQPWIVRLLRNLVSRLPNWGRRSCGLVRDLPCPLAPFSRRFELELGLEGLLLHPVPFRNISERTRRSSFFFPHKGNDPVRRSFDLFFSLALALAFCPACCGDVGRASVSHCRTLPDDAFFRRIPEPSILAKCRLFHKGNRREEAV
jgi:hypothetical protein